MGKAGSGVWLLLLLSLLPPVAGAVGYLAEVGYPANPALTDEAYFVAADGLTRFERASGPRQWRILAGERVNAPVLAAGRLVLSSGRRLLVVDQASGSIRWSRDIAGNPFAPVVAGGRIYVATHEGELIAFSLQRGTRLWRVRPGQGWLYPPAVQGDRLVSGGQDGVLWAFDAADGRILWRRDLGQELVYGPLALDRQRLVATTFSGAVLAVDGGSGRPLWERRFASPSLQPLLVAGVLVLPGMDGVLRGLDPVAGEQRWRHATGARLLPGLSGRDRQLLVTTDEGDQLVFDGATGEPMAGTRLPGELLASRLVQRTRTAVFLSPRNEPAAGPVLVYVNDP